MELDPPRIGLTGCGSSLALYDGIQRPQLAFQLVAAADADPGRRQHIVDVWAVRSVYETQREMLTSESLQLVLIATPPSTHADLILEAVDFGVPILVQKPLTCTLSEAERVLSACSEHGVPLRVSFSRRYTPAFLRAYDVIQTLGTPLALRVRWCSKSGAAPRSQRRWKQTGETLGGVLADLGTHVVDVARWWLGDVETSFLAMAIVIGDLENIAAFVLRHSSGASTSCYISNVEDALSESYEYVGLSGGLTLSRRTDGYPGAWDLMTWTRDGARNLEKFEPPQVSPFLVEVQATLTAVRLGGDTVDPGHLGLRALEATTQLYRSASRTPTADLREFSLAEFFESFPRV